MEAAQISSARFTVLSYLRSQYTVIVDFEQKKTIIGLFWMLMPLPERISFRLRAAYFLLPTCSPSHKHADVRQAAVRELAISASSDENASLRGLPVEELVRGWKDDPGTLDFLNTLAVASFSRTDTRG
jgi:hypothetical protein